MNIDEDIALKGVLSMNYACLTTFIATIALCRTIT